MPKRDFKNVKQPKMLSNPREPLVRNVSPSVDLRFLHLSGYSLGYVYKKYGRSSEMGDFLKDFERFIYDFSGCSNIRTAKERYQSHNNATKKVLLPDRVKNVIKEMPSEMRGYIKNEIMHLHMKPSGKGKELLWGYFEENVFYILCFDVEHETI